MPCRRRILPSQLLRSRRPLQLRAALYLASRHWCQRFAIGLAGANANDMVQRLHEDLAVADRTGARRVQDRRDRWLHEWIGHCHLDAYLLAELEHHRRAAIMLHDLLLAAVSARP